MYLQDLQQDEIFRFKRNEILKEPDPDGIPSWA